jgi:hypothetical protein
MASRIVLHVVNEYGQHLSEAKFKVDYGDEKQIVVIVLRDPDVAHREGSPFREALNESMAEQLAMQEGYDA